MAANFWLDQVPLWGVFILTIILVFVSIMAGILLGARKRRQPGHEEETTLGTVIGASLGLLAFMLAITFGSTMNFLQTRRQLFLDEVNAIGTTYLRAALFDEPLQGEIRDLLREYVDLRIRLVKLYETTQADPEAVTEAVSKAAQRSEQLQEALWDRAIVLARNSDKPVLDALFINSLNQMIDLQTSRLTAFRYRLPGIVWYVLFTIAVISMFMVGYQIGLSGKNRVKMQFLLAVTFSVVVLLITDLDRSTEGHFQVNQQPMIDLQKQLLAEVNSPRSMNPPSQPNDGENRARRDSNSRPSD